MSAALELMPYQIEGAQWLAHDDRCGLHDDMGVGKTAQAIHALDLVGARRVLIVAPAGVVDAGVWPGEFKKWSHQQRRTLKGRSVHELGAWLKGRADVLVVSYERAAKWAKHIESHADVIDVVIFDEAHYLKTPTAQRTVRALGPECDGDAGVARWGVRTWFLTGTPMPNDPADIWSTLRFVGGTPLRRDAFVQRYFRSYHTTFNVHQRPRAEMVPELRQAIRAKFLRRTFNDIGYQLPPVFLTTRVVDGDTDEIAALLREFPDMEPAIMRAIESGGLSFLDAQHVATLRRLVGEAKAPAYANLIADELEGGLDNVVIGGLHTRALQIVQGVLTARGLASTMFVGATSAAQREAAVKDFQAGKLRALVGHLKSLGTGITLTASSSIDIFEEDWSPAVNAQFLKRVHRIGQTKSVRARFVSLADSIDEIVSQRVAEKTAAIFQVQGS